ncbi:shikimate dehydrogenase [Sedimentibacter sp. zth1]|uniref:shikimate dehydrogenase n=1 Tax=Sedimentibacter sp. zth1 TaxID=2816908 RepID=UPI001A91D675|nr:shikimate dehydrogenase [Sedimentibacter sp. zth1]QSX06091.1 shikimate dehydrogenase [Sedimentibacter sp. zth1]
MSIKFGLIGEKLGHTYSPLIHSKIFEYLNLSATYDTLEYQKSEVSSVITKLNNLNYRGVNVTIPYKTEIIQYLDDISNEASKIGAINTISFRNNIAIGYNTDYFGFEMLLKYNQIDISNKKALILGTGGVSRAVLQCLLDNNIKDIAFASTDIKSAKTKYNDYKILSYKQIKDIHDFDILINCTPVGMYKFSDSMAIDKCYINKFKIVIDLIYNPIRTTLLKTADEFEIKTANGMYMLIAQAVKAEEIWNDIKIDNNIIDNINALITKEIKGE